MALQHPMAPVTQPSAHGLLPTVATGLSSATINRRVTKACQFAGAGGGFSGHSGRVGMAVDLAALARIHRGTRMDSVRTLEGG